MVNGESDLACHPSEEEGIIQPIVRQTISLDHGEDEGRDTDNNHTTTSSTPAWIPSSATTTAIHQERTRWTLAIRSIVHAVARCHHRLSGPAYARLANCCSYFIYPPKRVFAQTSKTLHQTVRTVSIKTLVLFSSSHVRRSRAMHLLLY